MLWWIVGLIAAWIVLSAVAAIWIGRAVRHADAQETAIERRRLAGEDQDRHDVA